MRAGKTSHAGRGHCGQKGHGGEDRPAGQACRHVGEGRIYASRGQRGPFFRSEGTEAHPQPGLYGHATQRQECAQGARPQGLSGTLLLTRAGQSCGPTGQQLMTDQVSLSGKEMGRSF